jgi:hypothetical protein
MAASRHSLDHDECARSFIEVLHRNPKNGSMMIGQPAGHARSMFAV